MGLVGLGRLLLEVEEQLARNYDHVGAPDVVDAQRLEVGELLDDQRLEAGGELVEQRLPHRLEAEDGGHHQRRARVLRVCRLLCGRTCRGGARGDEGDGDDGLACADGIGEHAAAQRLSPRGLDLERPSQRRLGERVVAVLELVEGKLRACVSRGTRASGLSELTMRRRGMARLPGSEAALLRDAPSTVSMRPSTRACRS